MLEVDSYEIVIVVIFMIWDWVAAHRERAGFPIGSFGRAFISVSFSSLLA